MKFCKTCGKELEDGAIVCMGCGCAVEQTPVAAAPSSAHISNPKEPFGSTKSITATVLSGIGVVLPIIGIIPSLFFGLLGASLLSIVCLACLIMSIVALVQSIKAKKARKTDSLSIISLIVSICGIVICAVIGLISTVTAVFLLILVLIYGGTYLAVFAAWFIAFLAVVGISL